MNDGSHVLLLGGARSGKSRAAEKAASKHGPRVLYVATAEAKDDEMTARIDAHRAKRPGTWRTLEAPRGVGAAVREALLDRASDAVIVDCVTMLVSNLLLAGPAGEDPDSIDEAAAQARVDEELDGLLDAIRSSALPWILVSNEVGSGVVPATPLGRAYRDLLGRANQRLAASAAAVYLMVAGRAVNLTRLATDELSLR
jgi:adenosylcobinamide kinase/adenosylcobinamide-phosphate guanylyltransferase